MRYLKSTIRFKKEKDKVDFVIGNITIEEAQEMQEYLDERNKAIYDISKK